MIKALILLFLLPTQVFSNSCELAFYNNYKTNSIEAVEKIRRGSFRKFKKRILAATDKREKLDLIEEEYALISNIITNNDQQIKVLIQSQNLDQEAIQKLYREAYLEVISKHKEHINFITNQSKLVLEDVGVSVQIRFKDFGDGVRVKYLELNPNPSSSSFANKLLSRYMSAMNTKTVTFDFFQNIQMGSAGFSRADKRLVDLGIRGVRNIAVDDIVTMVAKHEFKHAGFANMRAKGQDSIYHPQYISLNQSALSSSDTSIYNTYMSVEEIYNYANNPYWASARIKKLESYNIKDSLNDIQGIQSYIKKTSPILKQSDEVSEVFIKLMKEADISDTSQIKVRFTNQNHDVVQNIDEAVFVSIVNPSTNHMMSDFLSNTMREAAQSILEARGKLRIKYTKDFEKIDLTKTNGTKLADELDRAFHLEEVSLTKDSYELIIQKLIKKQTVINAVSKRMIDHNSKLLAMTDDLLTDLKVAVEDGLETVQTSPVWQKRFTDTAYEYQRFGKLVREDYKDFVAKDIKEL